MKKAKTIEFKLRDVIPFYGAVKDILSHREIYLKPLKDFSVKEQGLISLASFKIGLYCFYHTGLIKTIYDYLDKILWDHRTIGNPQKII